MTPAISDDARNSVNRRYALMQNQIPAVSPRQLTYDIRATTYSTVISTVNLTQWSISQQPWHQFSTNLRDLCELTNEECPAPTLHRTMPNHRYLFNNQDPSPDTMQTDNRILGWAKSNFFWTEYLACLPPVTRRQYLNMPPTPADVAANKCLTRFNTKRLGGYPRDQAPALTTTTPATTKNPHPAIVV